MKPFATLALGLILLALPACAAAVPVPTEADVPVARRFDPAADVPRLELGRARYVARCSGCHALKSPTEQTADAWPRELDVMAVKARLSPDERHLVEVYLRTIASKAAGG